ncbi:DUF3187 family protein [Aliivibrio wodanis]|uniref:DUF3187 family protein n=1 Tax=Aliivibrio wodanis TaxID=80852 RepID=UPI00406D1E89
MKKQLSLLLLTSTTFSVNAAQPLFVSAQSPIHSNVLSLQLREAQAMQPGQYEIKTSYTKASIWAETGDYFLDYYQNNIDLALTYQATPILKTEVGYKRITAQDNGLDELTKNFHDFFGIGQNGRDEVDDDRFYISIPSLGVQYDDFEGETLTNAFFVYSEVAILQTAYQAVSVGGTLYYNHVDSGPFARSSFEQGLQVNYSFHQYVHHFYTSTGLVHRNGDVSDEVLNSTAAFLSLGYEYQFSPQHSVLLESHNYGGWANENEDFSETSNEVVVGYRYTYAQAALEVAMHENARNMDNSTDIAFSLGLRIVM